MTPHDAHSLMTDVAVGGTAITAPLWLNAFNATIQELMLVGGLVLLIIRIFIAIKDLRGRRKRRATDRAD